MLKITIPSKELYDEENNKFFKTQEYNLELEHSLESISKWESKWNKPFLENNNKTQEETLDYIRCMTLNENIDEGAYNNLTSDNITSITDYINSPMTATTFSKNSKGHNREIVTSELVYCWMIMLNIPMECQKWHLNRLLTLIRVCEIKNSPPEKMGRSEILRRNAALNASRKAKLGTKG